MNITENALVKRINRKLAHEGQALQKSRGANAVHSFGEWSVWDVAHNTTLAYTHVDLEQLGRELNVLREDEHLAEPA